jgi:class 3 adenylate cyclase
MEPENLVRMLNNIFTRFDALAERSHLEKIKTLGDCYFVCGGACHHNAMHICAFAFPGW